MRIISQNGKVDIPYHLTILGVRQYGGEFHLVGHIDGSELHIGVFSTEDRAKEELQHIRDAYEIDDTLYYVVKGE